MTNLFLLMAHKIFSPSFQLITFILACFLILLNFQTAQAQTQLEFAAGSYPSPPNGPTTSTSATLLENTAGTFVGFIPTISVAASISAPQPYANQAGITPSSGLTFGSTSSGSSTNGPGTSVFSLMNILSGAPSASFTSDPNGTTGTGIATGTNSAFSIFASSQPLFNAGTATAPTNGRFYYGDLTLTFSQPVSNPVIHLVGLGGLLHYP